MSFSAVDDAVLIRQSQAGDRSAFDALVRKYEARAYQYAYRLTHDQEIAGDIVADAFIRVYSALANFRGQSAFGTWLYRILTNCYLDFRKKEKNHQHLSLDASVASDGGDVERQIEDHRPGPDDEAEKSEREAIVQHALTQMPEYQQAMLVMYHVESLSYEEISAALDLPIGTVKSRLNRARVALRDHLTKDSELFQMG